MLVQYRKYRENIQLKIATFFFITEEANNFEEKRNKQRRNTKSREIESENSSNTSGLHSQKMQEKYQ
jgi:hypothetical protein